MANSTSSNPTASLIFTHPFIPEPLCVITGADDINWTYTLNTQRYPTYGGEVVQILSCFIDTLTIQGTSARQHNGNYANAGMEDIYQWFVLYMQIASQGGAQTTRYSERYITCEYVERNWIWNLQVQDAPGYMLDRDTAAPTWQISGKIVDIPGSGMSLGDILNGSAGMGNGIGADIAAFQAVADGVSNKYPDPTQDPFINPLSNAKSLSTSKNQKNLVGGTLASQLGTQFQQIVQSWSSGDYSSLLGSTPSSFGPTTSTANGKTTKSIVNQAAGKNAKANGH